MKFACVLLGLILTFITGTALTWTSPETSYLNSTDTGPFNGTLTNDEASWIGGLLSPGAVLGPFIAGYLADKIGRKYTMLAISVPFLLSSIFLAFSKIVAEFYVARFITGLCVGASLTILPVYVGEMALDKHRSFLGSSITVSVSFGAFCTYVAGSLIENVLIFNIFLTGLTVAFFVIFWFFGYESPHWYVSKSKHELAKQVLLKIRNTSEEAIEKELDDIKSFLETEQQGGISEIFKSRGNTKAFIMGSGLVFFQQTSGVNAILFFAQSIFQNSGSSLKASYCSMIIGGVLFGSSFINPLISNRLGRKTLLIFSGVGMFIFEALLGIYSIIDDNDHEKVRALNFLPIILLILYIIVFNTGFGPIPWTTIAEIYPSNVKAIGSALTTSICWTTSFFITNWFRQIVKTVGQGQCFLGFAVASLAGAIFSKFFVLETKGKTLAQIQIDLKK